MRLARAVLPSLSRSPRASHKSSTCSRRGSTTVRSAGHSASAGRPYAAGSPPYSARSESLVSRGPSSGPVVADHPGGSLRGSLNGRGVPGAAVQAVHALAAEGWEFPKPLTCIVGESDPDHENFRRIKQGPGTLNPISKGGADGGAVRGLWLDFCGKKQGAAGITTAAPYVAGRWGRGNDRLPR